MTTSAQQTASGKGNAVTGDDDDLWKLNQPSINAWNAWALTPSDAAWQNVVSGGATGSGTGQGDPTTSDARPLSGGNSGTTTTSTSTTTTTTTTTTGTTTTSPFVINVNWDASVASAPAAFQPAVMAAVQYLESQFSDAVTMNIDVGYGELAGYSLGSSLGSSGGYSVSVGYSSLLSALSADQKTASDASVVGSMPSTMPVSGTLKVSTAEGKALGLVAANSTALDGYIGLSSSYAFDYNPSDGITAGSYDFNGVVLHEITELMGRTMDFGATTSQNYTFYDLLHYSAPGVRDLSATTPGYFSVDGGVTNLAAFNTNTGGDGADWASSMGNDSFNAFSYSGVVNGVSTADLTALDALGWDLTSAITTAPTSPTAPQTTTAPTGVAVSDAGATAAGAMSAAAALANVTQTGGDTTHSYSYALGGSGASAFSLATANNAATLSSGAAGLAGSTSGTLYALTLTTTDTTAGLTSPTVPVDVIVGTSGADSIAVAGLVGSATGTPAFIYGGAGNDTLNGSGMTGKLWFVGGDGADRMTGGAGGDTYIYGAASDSTASAMDVISNFAAGADVIDLTGLRTALGYSGAIGTKGKNANMLGAHSIGYQQGGGNTYVYVNTSGTSQNISAANMKIDLAGSVALTSANFLHQ